MRPRLHVLTLVAAAALAAVARAGCPATDEDIPRDQWAIDSFFVLVSYAAFGCLLGTGAVFLLLLLCLSASFLVDRCRREGAEPIAAGLFSACTSYFGLTYLAYLFTIPLFGKPSSLRYPEAPHLSPERPEARPKDVLLRLLYNGIWLALSAYLVLIAVVVLGGLCVVLPVALIILGSLLLICRTADWVDRKARDAAQRGEHRMGANKESGGNNEGSQAEELLPQGCGCTLPYLKCTFEFTRLTFFAFSISFKAFFDFLLLLSVNLTWPSIRLPSFRISFDFDWPNLFPFGLPCFRLPDIDFGCAFTAHLYELLLLSVSTITVAVVISSDIMVMLYDRIDRCKMVQLSIFKKEERCAFIRHTFLLQVIQGCMFTCWKVVEVITSFAAVSVIRTVRVFLDLQERQPSDAGECKVALYGVSKIVTAYVLLVVLVQILRVGTGHVQRNLVYVCSVPLTDSEYPLCQLSQLRHLVAVLRMSVGSFLMPFVNLGIRGEGLKQVQAAMEAEVCWLDRNDPLTHADLITISSKGFEHRKSEVRERGTALQIVVIYLDAFFYKCFGAGAILQSALLELHHHQRARKQPPSERALGPLGKLQIGAMPVTDYTRLCLRANEERKAVGWCQGIKVMAKKLCGISDQSVLRSVRALGRSHLWQSQIESVHKASGNHLGITLQTIPLVGVFLGKVAMYLNEHPTWVMAMDPALGSRSLRWYDGEVKPSLRLKVLYLLSVLKVTLLLCAFFTGQVLLCFIGIFVAAFIEGLAAQHMKERSKVSRIYPSRGSRRQGAPAGGGVHRIVHVSSCSTLT